MKPMFIHASSYQLLQDWVTNMKHQGMISTGSIAVINVDLRGFEGPFTGRSVILNCDYIPYYHFMLVDQQEEPQSWNISRVMIVAVYYLGIWPLRN